MNFDIKQVLQKLTKSKFILPLLLAALALLLLLPKGDGEELSQPLSECACLNNSLEEEEKRLKQTLELISGAGQVQVLLSIESSGERVLAENGDEVVIVSAGSGREEAVELYSRHLQYKGAVVVCEGANDAEVRLSLTRAVAAFTGLGSDEITILTME